MTPKDNIVIVSADSHAAGPAEGYLEYMDKDVREKAYALLMDDERRTIGYFKPAIGLLRPELVEVIDDRGAIRSGKVRGAYDAKCRLQEMDEEGIAAEIIFPGAYTGTVPFFSALSAPRTPELRFAGARAYNRWLADQLLSESADRLFGVFYPGTFYDLDAEISEMHWAANNGFVAVACPGYLNDPQLPPLHDEYWKPFWASCADLGLVVVLHAGFRRDQQGALLDISQSLMHKIENDTYEIPLDRSGLFFESPEDAFGNQPLYEPRRALWEIMLGGAFDEFPQLKVAITEVRVDWVPGLIQLLDQWHEKGKFKTRHSPSYYWQHNCWGVASPPRPPDITMRQAIGVERLVFGRDYPHAEGSWPNTRDWLRAAFTEVSEKETRQILGLNAIECYGLDYTYLSSVACRIGPTVDDVLGAHEVDPRYIENFDLRAGFNKPVEQVNTAFVEHQLVDTMAAIDGRN